MIFIIDIDSTIADNSHRVGMLEKTCKVCLGPVPPKHRAPCPNCGSRTNKIKQSSWDKFLMPELVAKDFPVVEAQRCIRGLKERGIEHHYLTGRNDGLREVTHSWLVEHFGFDAGTQQLIMRDKNMHNVSASDYKEMAFTKFAEQRDANTNYIFCEDDEYVFSMYEKYGLVLRCPEAWSSFLPIGENRKNEPDWNM